MEQEENITGYRLSPQQQNLWWRLTQSGVNHPFRSVCAAELRGTLDASRLARALTLACRRHESLRTRFELGGHSLLAIQLLAGVRSTFQVKPRFRSVLQEPTIAAIAAQVERLLGERRELLESQAQTAA